MSGHIVHIHLFLAPLAGSTPFEDTASTATVRHVIIARGAIGVYGGGGFLRPSSTPGSETLTGSIRHARLRLLAATPDFQNRLGAAELDANYRVPHNEGLARAIAARLSDLIRQAERQP